MRLIAIILLLFPLLLLAQDQEIPCVLILDHTDLRSSVDALPELTNAGMQVRVIVAPGAFFGTTNKKSDQLAKLGSVYTGPVSAERMNEVAIDKRIALRYLNDLLAGVFETADVLAPMDWNEHTVPHALEVPLEELRTSSSPALRMGGGGAPEDWTCGYQRNSETMEGVIIASTFFVESDGTIDADTYTWTQTHIDDTKTGIIDSWSIWSFTAGQHGASVVAVMDWYEAATSTVQVQGYEPILHIGLHDYLWAGAIMTNMGRSEPGAFKKVFGFNHDQRVLLNADRSLTAFVAYNPSGAPITFTDSHFAHC